MSGGSHGYSYQHVREMAEDVRVRLGSPLRRAFAKHLLVVADAMRAIEWNDSSDGDDREESLIRLILGPHAELRAVIEEAHRVRGELDKAVPEAQRPEEP